MQPCDILSQAYHAARKFRMTYTHQRLSDPGRCIVFHPPEKSAATTAPRGVSALWFGFLLCRNLCANLSCIACELGESSLPILRCIPAILRWYASVNYKCIKVTCIGNWQRVCGLAQKMCSVIFRTRCGDESTSALRYFRYIKWLNCNWSQFQFGLCPEILI